MLLDELDDYGQQGPGDITALLLQPVEWQRDAACAELDPDIFFPERGGSSKAARAVCARCPVVEDCLTYALENREEYGIWGGTSERERRGLRRHRRGRGASERQPLVAAAK